MFYVFIVTEGGVDENDLGPTYRMVVNRHDRDGRWGADTEKEAIRLAARGRDGIYAAFHTNSLVMERWPFTIDEYAAQADG